jgi:tetratricopeptide (TPR) repeat protein
MPRHQTLRAAMDWSYNLLVEPEQLLFRRLSIFAGGWTLGAAEFVCADSIPPAPPSKGGLKEGDILEWHSHLIVKSLVLAEEKKGTTRYRMPETIRQYAHEKLAGSDEGEGVRKRHLEYFMKFAEGGEPKLQSAEQKTWLKQLELEHDNLRAAFEWGIQNDTEAALRLACSVQEWWSMRGQIIEGREWTTRLLARIERFQSAKSRARAYNLASFVANRRRDFQAARGFSVIGLENARSSGSDPEIAMALRQMGNSLRFLGEASSARPFFEESLEMYRALKDDWGIAYTLIGLGGLAIEGGGDYLLAQSLYEKSIEKYRSIGDQYTTESC